LDSYTLHAWAQAIVRWIHVFAAILWIGQTYLFHFFERHLERRQDAPEGVVGDLWMVHGGGFYRLEKQEYRQPLPTTLHWFKWEAAATWLSGVVLIVLTYYMGGLLVAPQESFGIAEAGMSFGRAAWCGAGAVFGAWLAYDLLVRSPLGRRPVLFAGVGLLLLLGIFYGLRQVMETRAAWIHVGAVIGTVMAANVWLCILPAQRRLLAAVATGKELDPTIAASGPLRSKHNSYMVVPLVLLMIGNHYPTLTYSHSHAVLVLGGIVLVGWLAARWMLGR